MDQSVDQTLATRACDSCGVQTYEGNTACHNCRHKWDTCAVSGYPVMVRRARVGGALPAMLGGRMRGVCTAMVGGARAGAALPCWEGRHPAMVRVRNGAVIMLLCRGRHEAVWLHILAHDQPGMVSFC